MADKWPLANGNWSNAANWNGGTKPVPGDDVYADGRTVSIDENVNVASLRTTQRSGGTAGGVFTANNAGALTINANIIAGTTAVLTRTGTVDLLAVVGNTTGGTAANSFGISMGNTTSIHLTGNATGGSGASSHGLALANQSIATVIGNATGGSGLSATGINASSISSLVMTGNCTGGSVANANGLNMSGGNTVTVNGDATAGTGQSAQGIVSTTGSVVTLNGNVYGGTGTLINAWGLQCGGAVTVNGDIYGGTAPNGFGTQIQPNGSLTVNGNAIPGNGSNCTAIATQTSTTLTLNGTAFGNNFGDGIVVNLNPGVVSLTGTAYIRRVVSGTYGVFGVSGSFYIIDHAGTEIECREGPNGDTLTLVSAASVGDPPAVSDVREGVSYHYDTLTGTLAVPLPSQVLTGVETDDTVGTWVNTAITVNPTPVTVNPTPVTVVPPTVAISIPAIEAESIVLDQEVTKYRGTLWSFTVEGLVTIPDKAYWTIKRSTESDAKAALQVIATNPTAEGDGLKILNGSAVQSAQASRGSITFESYTVGDDTRYRATLQLLPTSSAAILPDFYKLDLKDVTADADSILAECVLRVLNPVTLATS